jgi:hypothetical protein
MMSGDLMPFFMEGVKQSEARSKTTIDIIATNNLIMFLNLLPSYCGKLSNAGGEPRMKAGAQRSLECVGSTAMLGSTCARP